MPEVLFASLVKLNLLIIEPTVREMLRSDLIKGPETCAETIKLWHVGKFCIISRQTDDDHLLIVIPISSSPPRPNSTTSSISYSLLHSDRWARKKLW